MARADTLTKLPLDRFARMMGLSPLHFNSLFVQFSGQTSPTVCAQPWWQYEWQAVDRVSREEVARAIAQAESDIERHLGYRLLPTWEADEWHMTGGVPQAEYVRRIPLDSRGFLQAVRASWGYVVTGGIRAKSLLAAAQAIVFDDQDGDGYKERATILAAVPVGTLPCEVHVYYAADDTETIAETAGDDRYEIRPVTVSVTGAVATINCRREQLVKPALLQYDVIPSGDTAIRPLDGLVDANFVSVVDVYRVYNDPSTQATLLWEPFGDICSCGTTGCAMCAYSAQTACLTLRSEPRLGHVGFQPGTWNTSTAVFDSAGLSVSRQPEHARLWYLAGWQGAGLSCPRLEMDFQWAQVVAKYAAALLERPVCECTNAHAYVARWQRDLAVPGGERLQISARDLDNPFGTRAGAVQAWRAVMAAGPQAAIGGAVLA